LLADPDVTRVRAVARRPIPASPRVEAVQADLREPAARRALEGVDVLYHLGFALWRNRRGESARQVNIEGTRNLVAARPGHIVFASSAAVYGAWPDNPVPLTEDATPRPNTECPYAADKLLAEEICAQAAPTTTMRIVAVLGPGADPQVARAARGYRLVVPAIRGARQALQFLHEDDAAAALARAGRLRRAGVYNVAPAGWLDERQLADAAGGRVLWVPRRVALGATEAAFRLRLSPFGVDRAIFLTGPLALANERSARELGWEARRSSAKTLRDFLAA
jgi:nucleoside-diphosphate-sugar epimerase